MASHNLLLYLLPPVLCFLARISNSHAYENPSSSSTSNSRMFTFPCSGKIKTCNASLYHINNGIPQEQIASLYSVNTTQLKPILHSRDQVDYLITVPCSCENIDVNTSGYFYDTSYLVQPNDSFYDVSNRFYSGQRMNTMLTQNPSYIDVGWVLYVPMEKNGLPHAHMKGISRREWFIVIGILSAATLLSMITLTIILLRRKKSRQNIEEDPKTASKVLSYSNRNYSFQNKLLKEQFEDATGFESERPVIFSLEEVEKATDNFDESQIIGRGGYGSVFLGMLGGQIDLDAAKGIEYIHDHTKARYVHRDIKTSNILLDVGLRAKVADFGLAKLVERSNEEEMIATRLELQVTSKTDVFTFGVVLTELITGQQALSLDNREPTKLKSLITVVYNIFKDDDRETALEEVIDGNLRGSYPLEDVYKEGYSGGLCLFWKADVVISILSYSRFYIDTTVESFNGKLWRLTGFYGHPNSSQHIHGWTLLRRLAGVNFQKSTVCFSKQIAARDREVMADILEMEIVESHLKYLGLPCATSRSKCVLFSDIKDRVWKKISSWSHRFFLSGGREVLLKAVIQAIPVYSMNLFKLSASLISDLHPLCARFWWSGGVSKMKMHWRSWEFLCKARIDGDNMGKGEFELLCVSWWRIWFGRNPFFHSSVLLQVNDIFEWCVEFLKDYQQPKVGANGRAQLNIRSVSWRLPPPGFSKINMDTALNSQVKCSSMGVVIQDTAVVLWLLCAGM
ncbi:hypothetical protein Ddye_030056 [Dipteronia dyeriana]|uniref:Protein kinase domain-containing protein n=1 Tax=Dipteronia dyeriana TaxID=168575 RepID=A0AAD9WL53_9ROSI|nr:hypothetical protein Ddye_030056 [Dipteronia dyeriana]